GAGGEWHRVGGGPCRSRRRARRYQRAAGCGQVPRRGFHQKNRCTRGGPCREPANRRRCARGTRPIERPMIRVAFYLILVGAIAYGVALLADQPGDVIVTWQGLRMKTSPLVLGAATLAAAVVLSFVF